jgi:hypothetical protein
MQKLRNNRYLHKIIEVKMKIKMFLLISLGMILTVTGCTSPNELSFNFLRNAKSAPSFTPAAFVKEIKTVAPMAFQADALAGLPANPVDPTEANSVKATTTLRTVIQTGSAIGAGAINPLTGLPVQNAKNLLLPPALVTITNWPPSARPQAGLTFSPIVFEWYIGEGMSRYQAMFYGDYPQQATNPVSNSNNNSFTSPHPNSADAALGPVRSGRLPFEKVRALYNGFLIMASAYKGVAQHLSEFSNVFGSDSSNINSAMIKVTQLQNIAVVTHQKMGDVNLTGMVFNAKAPSGGQPASRLWFMYNVINELIWNYDGSSGVYHRYQYTEDNKNTFVQDTDKLNGNPLGYSNVVILFAEHRACTETAFDVDLMYVNRAPALLFRDGQVYKIYWTTKNGVYENTTGKVRPIRFIDEQGNAFPLKPGQTWIHVMPTGNRVWETATNSNVDAMLTDQNKVDSGVLYNWIKRQQPGSGIWATQYAASLMIQDDAVCQSIRNMQ